VTVSPPSREVISVPTKINVLKNVNMSDDDIALMMATANAVLSQAGVILSPWRVNRDVSDTGNDDGNIDQSEKDGIRKKATDELKHHFKKNRGYKVWIGNVIADSGTGALNPNISGLSSHYADASGNPLMGGGPPTNQAQIAKDTSPTVMGRALAHEFIHSMTVGPHSGDINNIMYRARSNGSGTPRGTDITPEQAEEIRKGARQRGDTLKVGSVVRVETKQALWSDDVSDTPSEYVDLLAGSLFAEATATNIVASVGLRGMYPSGSDVDAQVQMFFDTDDSTATGQDFGVFEGIEKIVSMGIAGRYPFTGASGSTSSTIFDVGSSTETTIEVARVTRFTEIICPIDLPTPDPEPRSDSVEQTIPVAQLGSLADTVPVGIRVTESGVGEQDEANVDFEFEPAPSSEVSLSALSAQPGDSLTLDGLRFPGSRAAVVLINDRKVLDFTTNPDGTFSQTFALPDLEPGYYFVGADSNPYDFTLLYVESAPAPIPDSSSWTWVSLAVAGAALLLWASRKRAVSTHRVA